MLLPEFYEDFIAPLNKSGIEYMVTGSMAAVYYGEPRCPASA